MANRLTRIYTRTGDGGDTGLADGSRVGKDSPRIAAIGDVDELNSWLGLLAAQSADNRDNALLQEIQNRLFDLGGELAIPGHDAIAQPMVDALEGEIERYNGALPPLRDFILPGGSPQAAHCHLARSVCRRAERSLLALSRLEPINAASLKFLNRLSDLLFVMARSFARQDGGKEILWQAAGSGKKSSQGDQDA